MLKTFYSDNLYTREPFENLWVKICPKYMKNKLKVFNRNKFTYMEEKNIFLLCLSWFQLLKANVTGVRIDDWSIPPLLQTVEEIRDEFSTSVFLKAVSEHSIIGSLRSHVIENTCHIGRLIVHPEWQNLGIGTRLMIEVELTCRDVILFELFTGSNSIRNLHLYHKLGYQEFRRELLGSKVELVYLEKIVIGKKKNIGYQNS